MEFKRPFGRGTQPAPQRSQPEKASRCRVRTRKSQDGRVMDKEISGCSPSELKAIMNEEEKEQV